MSFWGYPFIFDNIPSETYGLVIARIGGGSTDTSSGGSDVEIIKQKLTRKANYFIQGVEQSTPLSFDLQILSANEIPRDKINIIQTWLFGQMKYKKLQVVQTDLLNVSFNCMLTSPEIVTVGNVPYGFTCKVECDAPWGWERDAEYKIATITSPYSFKYYNSSDDNNYTYPTVTFTTTSAGTVSFQNITDNNRVMTFTNLQANDTITINTNLQIVTSSNGDNILSKSNFKWLRLVQGYNDLKITGSVKDITITHNVARKVGS